MTETFQEDQVMEQIRYWDEQREALGFETVWSMWEWSDIDQNILRDGVKRVTYTFIRGDATLEEIQNDQAWIQVSALAVNGTVRELWRAAESCFQQAKQQGDWHKFIEDFEIQEDGSWELTMGS